LVIKYDTHYNAIVRRQDRNISKGQLNNT
jgi:hypothetical protein